MGQRRVRRLRRHAHHRRHRALRARLRGAAPGRRGRARRTDCLQGLRRMHTLGPKDGTLLVHTGKGGAAAKAGHELTIEVTRWRGMIDEDGAMTLSADPRSLRVLEGTGGMSPLGDEEKAGITQTIDDEVLTGRAIEFRSTRVEQRGGRLDVSGELQLAGFKRPIDFALNLDDEGRLTGSAFVKQTDWKMKPFSALFGTLKVADVVEVSIDARVGAALTLEARHG